MTGSSGGVDRGLTSYGDEGFSRFLRRAFLASAGLDESDLDRPVVGIADTSSTPSHWSTSGSDAVKSCRVVIMTAFRLER